MMLQCEVLQATTGQVVAITPEEVGRQIEQPADTLWVDISQPTPEDIDWVGTTFHLHPLALEDIRNQEQRVKLDSYDTYFFFVLRTIRYSPLTGRIDSYQMDTIVGRNFVVTLNRAPDQDLAKVHEQWRNVRASRQMPVTAFLFYLTIDALVDSYFPILDTLGDQIDDIDEAVLERPDTTIVQSIFTLRKSLLAMRKILAPTRDVLNELFRSEGQDALFGAPDIRIYLNDVFDHLLRLTDFVDTYRDMLSGSLDAYQSSLSNRLNTNMQRLTVAATVLATSTVITGFFGMNLQGMMINSPWPFGGLLVLGILAVVTAFEIWLFHRSGWL